MKFSTVLLAAVLLSTELTAGSLTAADPSYVCSPRSVAGGGIVYTDNYATALYLRRADGTSLQLAAAPGAGRYYTVSPDLASIGMKLIGEDGMQTPAVIDAATGSVHPLCEPSPKAGQVSFTRDGRCAFTLGTGLVIASGAERRTVDLGTYANIAPISPDGRRAAFNDDNDQLWTVDIATGARAQITDGRMGYFQPQWSPDGSRILYSSTGGSLFVFDCTSGATAALGQGLSPVWSDDGAAIAFYRTETAEGRLVNSDLYVASGDSLAVTRVTATPDVFEMDPSFVPGSPVLMYQTEARSEIRTCAIPPTAMRGTGTLQKSVPAPAGVTAQSISVSVNPQVRSVPAHATRMVNVPYINQVEDVATGFDGSGACAPTTAVMALAYHNLLPTWALISWNPSRHLSYWGYYISEQYTFKAITYSSTSNVGSYPARGAYGYMWSGGSPRSHMSDYYINHGLESQTTDSPSYASAAAEITAGNVYSICNMLTTAGHLVLGHDLDAAEPHTIIVNDPYGNKNIKYPSSNGKDAAYDWPGYNNGHQNFNSVVYGVTVHNTKPAGAADTTVDDLQFGKGFTMNTTAPATMQLWKDKNAGYKGHFWYCYGTWSQTVDTCFAIWTPNLPKAGLYEVFVNIPNFKGGFATVAPYKVASNNGVATVTINQLAIGTTLTTADTLVSLGTYPFDQGSSGYVRLGDATGKKGEVIIVDAMVWKFRGEAVTSAPEEAPVPGGYMLAQNYPNPFNPSTTIGYRLAASSRVRISVADMLGRECAVLVDGIESSGEHRAVWDASAYPAGMYFCRMRATETGSQRAGAAYTSNTKMLLVK